MPSTEPFVSAPDQKRPGIYEALWVFKSNGGRLQPTTLCFFCSDCQTSTQLYPVPNAPTSFSSESLASISGPSFGKTPSSPIPSWLFCLCLGVWYAAVVHWPAHLLASAAGAGSGARVGGDQLPVGPAQWVAAHSASGTSPARLPAGAHDHMGATVNCLSRAVRTSP